MQDLNNFIDKRIELLEARNSLIKRISELKRDLRMIDSKIGSMDDGIYLCPNCEYRADYKKQLKDHLFTDHAY